MELLPLWCFLGVFIYGIDGQCTFPAPFAGTVWLDNTKGTLNFTSTTMSGWSFITYTLTISEWQCHDNTNDTVLVMRSTSAFTVSGGVTLYSYMCLQLTKITDYSYIYYQMQSQQQNAGQERLKFATSGTLTVAEICDSTVTIPTLEFHVLVQSGVVEAAAIQCPDLFLFSADYSYTDSSTTEACTGVTDVWDMCTNTSQMSFDYTTCSQTIVGSTGGQFLCVANMVLDTMSVAVVYNQDTTLATGASQFACFVTDGSTASVAPKNCTGQQTPSALPLLADGTTTTGAVLTIVNSYYTCVPGSTMVQEDNAGLIAGITIGALIVIAIIVLLIILIVCYPDKLRQLIAFCNCCRRFKLLRACSCCLCCQRNKIADEKPILPAGAEGAVITTVDETSRGTRRQKSNLGREKTNVSTKDLNLSSPRATSTPTPREKTSLSLKDKSPLTSPRGGGKGLSPREKTSLSLKSVSEKSGKRERRDMGTMVYDYELGPRIRRPFLGLLWTKLVSCVAEGKETATETEENGHAVPLKEKTKSDLELPSEGPVLSEGSPTLSKSKKMALAGTGKKGKSKSGAGKAKSGLKTEKSTVSTKSEKPVQDEEESNPKPGLSKEKTSMSVKSGKVGRERSTVSAAGSPKLGRQKTTLSTGLGGKAEPTGSSASLRSTGSAKKGKGRDWTFLMSCFGNRKGEIKEEEEKNADSANGKVPLANGKAVVKDTNGIIKVRPATPEKSSNPTSKDKKNAKKASKADKKSKNSKKAETPPKTKEVPKLDKTDKTDESLGKKEKTETATKHESLPKGSPAKDKKEKDEPKQETVDKAAKEKSPTKDKSGKKETEKPEKATKEATKPKEDTKEKSEKGKDKKDKGKSTESKATKSNTTPKSKEGKKSKVKEYTGEEDSKVAKGPQETELTPTTPNAVQQSKTLAVSKLLREQTASTLDTSKVKIDVHLPNNIAQAEKAPSAKMTKAKGKTKTSGVSPKIKKSKTTLGESGASPKMKKSKTTLGDNVSAVEYYAPLHSSPSPKK